MPLRKLMAQVGSRPRRLRTTSHPRRPRASRRCWPEPRRRTGRRRAADRPWLRGADTSWQKSWPDLRESLRTPGSD